MSEDTRKAEATRVLGEILGHMGVKAALDVKDIPDGSISIALTIEGEAAGMTPGKRSHVVDSLQFLLNKIINKTPQSRRYINLGVGEHPAPKQARPPPPPQQPKPAPQKAPQAQKQPQRPAQQHRNNSQNEAQLECEEDSALTSAARELAEKSAKHGRFIGLIGMSPEDRARVLKAAKDVPGVQLKLEGDGRNRRLSLHPDKPSAMPKSTLPDYDDEEDDAGDDDEQE